MGEGDVSIQDPVFVMPGLVPGIHVFWRRQDQPVDGRGEPDHDGTCGAGAMTPLVLGLVLLAAMLHAGWNAMLRSGVDRMWSIIVMNFATTTLALPLLLFVPFPAVASWPYLGLSACCQVGYSCFLVAAYREGEFGQVYPIARGTAPLLVTLAAAIVADERLASATMLGIALISFGVCALARPEGAGWKPKAILNAFITGLFIAAYTVIDGLGARLAGNALSYSAVLFLLYGAVMPLFLLLPGEGARPRITSREGLKALGGGVVSMTAYGLVIWAVTLSPIGPVSALRETSVVFATLIGRFFLRERLTFRRLGASLVIAAGAICLGFAA
jgi:drug/metabolite transporter (DMT)-like permease